MTTRNRLAELNSGPTHSLNDQTSSFMQSRASRPTFGPAWGNGAIWGGSPIGSGMKSATDTNRANGRPVPLLQASSSESIDHDTNDAPEMITGSGSLLGSSESDGWSRRWTSINNISTNISNGLASARSNQAAASPARHRTNQHTRDSSPYFAQPPSAIGTGAAKPKSASLLDPTSRAFNASGVFGAYGQNLSSRQEAGEESGRRNLNGIHFGSMTTNGNMAYSGYNSSAASRNGSLPPSRHGADTMPQFGELPNSAIYPASADAFSHRQNQHSRNPTFSSMNGYNSNKFSEQAWQTSMGDLSAVAGKLDLGKSNTEIPLSVYWDQSQQMPSPGSVSSTPALSFAKRNGSISFDSANPMMSNPFPSYGQARIPFNDKPSYSPTDSDIRNGNDSPMYFNAATPPVLEHARGLSTNSSRHDLNAYNQSILERKLRGLAEQQQSYQPSPALSYRSLYNGGYDFNGSNNPAISRVNPQMPSYFGNVSVGGYTGHMPTGRAPPRGPASEMSAENSNRSPLLEEFRLSKGGAKRYELKDIYGHIVEFSGDQHGSRFIQSKLESANSDEKAVLFGEILENALQLMTDVFGNYVIQKFFEHGNQQQKKQLADKMKGHIPDLSLQMYGCRVVQKAFEFILVDQQAYLVKELENQVLKCVKDQNGNHVIQKAIQRIPAQHISFIINAFTNQVHQLATHPYGCRVIQRMLENCHEPAKTNILDELHICASNLIVDQYGNYVTQHIIEHGRMSDRNKIITIITTNLVGFATQKFASNVVEKSIQFATREQRQALIAVCNAVDTTGESTMQRLIRDQYGNYIIQKLIKQLQDREMASPADYQSFIENVKACVQRLKQYSYVKQIGQIEKLIDHGPPPILTSPQSNAGARPPQLDISSAPTPPLVNEDAQSPQSSSQPSTSNSTIGDPIGEHMADVPQKAPTTSLAVAEDLSDTTSTITAPSVSTPKAIEA